MKPELFEASQSPNQPDREFSIWEITFSSEFDVGEDCAKFKPCYIPRSLHEGCDTDAHVAEPVQICFLISNALHGGSVPQKKERGSYINNHMSLFGKLLR
jgi:hypothetical protein